jgi:AcrR family transcriptional regulator
VTEPRALTAKGAATRRRIVANAADQVLARGVGGTSLDDVGAATKTSKSQLFHYFPGGKHELVRAIAEFQGERVLAAQRPAIDDLASWESWAAWRDAVVSYYARTGGITGCPIGALTNEAAPGDPVLAAELTAYFRRWAGLLAAGVRRLRASGLVDDGADPDQLATELLAAVQGGLLLSRAEGTPRPLERALDGALAHLRTHATH